MDVLTISLLFTIISIALIFKLFYNHKSPFTYPNAPPGKTGYPILGETLEFLSTGKKGEPEKYVLDRMEKFKSNLFTSSLFGHPTAVFCGSAGNKFLFSNEKKLVTVWTPDSIRRLFPNVKNSGENQIYFKMLPKFLKAEPLQQCIGIMDACTQAHFSYHWDNKQQVLVYPLAKSYTFTLGCRLFLSLEDPVIVERMLEPFQYMASGMISMPINLPGTPFNRGIKASSSIKKELLALVRQRKLDLAEGKASETQDILSFMLVNCDENGKYMSEFGIADRILGLLFGAYDSTSVICSFIVKYLAELPHIYDMVYKEQMEIAKAKAETGGTDGELLNINDIQKMKYSWNVACEVLRLAPPFQGTYREAIKDFVFNGFYIPKGWKLYWSSHSTHRNPEYFPDPMKLDPSRFEGGGPAPFTFVPFGGGPRMCPGREYARLEILVFMHNLVKKYKWSKVLEDEKIVYNPTPIPQGGLPIRLYPHKTT